jgi:hypothetical protein
MKLPGRAWLEFEVSPSESGCTVRQTAVLDPSGLLGLAYWYGIYPLHAVVFRGMLAGIARIARIAREARREASTSEAKAGERAEKSGPVPLRPSAECIPIGQRCDRTSTAAVAR